MEGYFTENPFPKKGRKKPKRAELLAALKRARWHLRRYDQPAALAAIDKALAQQG